MRCQSILLALAGVMGLVEASSAQLSTPTHWRWITDRPVKLVTEQAVPDSAWRFVAMPPGWHITTGPGALLYDPAFKASDRFSVEAKIFLFPNPSDEGYGVFLGGRDLETSGRSALAFLIRRDGASAVVRMAGEQREFLLPWEQRKGPRAHSGSGTVDNILRLSAGPQQVVFLVNGDTVATVPRSDDAIDGHFGFRVGSKLNLHVSYLDYTRHLALPGGSE